MTQLSSKNPDGYDFDKRSNITVSNWTAGFKDAESQSREYWKECKKLHSSRAAARSLKKSENSKSNKNNHILDGDCNKYDDAVVIDAAHAAGPDDAVAGILGVARAPPTVTQNDDDISLAGDESEVEESMYWDNREKVLKRLRHHRKLRNELQKKGATRISGSFHSAW